MNGERMAQMKDQEAFLEAQKAQFPALFPSNTWVDDNNSLESLGIHIPGKESLPRGYLKLLPSDFIVEEITPDNRVTSTNENSPSIPDEDGGTVYATLVKCGLSTLEAVEELAKLLDTTKDKIQYAGIKDKDAITAQEISIRGINKELVEKITSPHFFLKDIRGGKGVVMKGGLSGNQFSILIRIGEDMQDESRVKNSLSALETIKKEGFYNFFYLQRFGAPRLNNYLWGIKILKGDYEGAIRGLIEDPGVRELPYFLNLRKEIIALAPDWKSVLGKLEELPLIFPSEIKVVRHLVDHPQDYLGALLKIEEQIVLWVSAVASLLYNRKLSSYIMAGIEPPKTLPLFLSLDKSDWEPYVEDLESIGLFPLNFRNISPFRNISLKHKDITTKDHAEVHAAEIIPEGIAVNFSLGKGEYATTFLSHFVTLLGGEIPENIKADIVNIKKILHQGDLGTILERFADLNTHKKIN
jgi:TruD family tRNA pseudouridine synthase